MTAGLSSLGNSVDPDTAAWVAAVNAAGGTVSAAQISRQSILVKAIKAAGAWNTPFIERMYLLFGDNDIHQPQIDIVNRVPFTFNGTGAFSSKWSALGGYTGNGSDNYIDPNYSTNGNSFGVNSASFIGYFFNSRSASQSWDMMGTHLGPSNFLSPMAGGNSYWAPMDRDGVTGAASTLSNVQGSLISTRTSSTTASMYQNEVLKATTSACPSPSSIGAMPIFFGGSSDNFGPGFTVLNPSGDTHGILGSGGGMFGAMCIAVQRAMNAYAAAWGVNVYTSP